METRTGFSLERCALDPHGDNGKDDVCLQFMSDQDYSLRAKSQIRKELLSGQAAKIGLSGWAAKIACMYVDSIYIYREREIVCASSGPPPRPCLSCFLRYCLVLHLSERRVSITLDAEFTF